jgi:hypothetical protein
LATRARRRFLERQIGPIKGFDGPNCLVGQQSIDYLWRNWKFTVRHGVRNGAADTLARPDLIRIVSGPQVVDASLRRPVVKHAQ